MRTKLETLVGIKFEIEGMHCYPNASANHGDGVKFLEQPHRHLFKFNCKNGLITIIVMKSLYYSRIELKVI